MDRLHWIMVAKCLVVIPVMEWVMAEIMVEYGQAIILDDKLILSSNDDIWILMLKRDHTEDQAWWPQAWGNQQESYIGNV